MFGAESNGCMDIFGVPDPLARTLGSMERLNPWYSPELGVDISDGWYSGGRLRGKAGLSASELLPHARAKHSTRGLYHSL